ncbi:MAG: SpoIIE family protein phosphatase [Candidatus Zixiibacteriota bacterium]
MRLIGTDGNQFYSWELNPGKYVIGRKSDCDFFIANSTISRRHAELEVLKSGVECVLSDLGSHNGTVVNGNHLVAPVSVKVGDHILFGETEFRVAAHHEKNGIMDSRPETTEFSDRDPEKSVFLSIDDALDILPSKVTDLPDVLPTIFEMAKILVLPEPKEEMLTRSLDLIAKVIPAERLAVLLRSEGESASLYTAATILPQGKDPGSFTLSRTIVNDILTNKNSLVIVDAQHDPRFAEQKSIVLSEMRSAMAVPLFDEGKVLGLLYVDTTNPMHRYTDDFLRLLATFGNIVASRLSNYLLLHERHEKQLIEQELRRASQIQKNLLTTTVPDIPCYSMYAFQEQCRDVGGDLYDMTQLPDGRIMFVVADVSGKGTGAALLMSNILASFRILYSGPSFDLHRAVNQVSQQLFKYSAPENFATLFIGAVDPKENKLSYLNAGHNPPMLVRADGSVTLLEASGTMIGAFDLDCWSEEETTMDCGDLLFVFSDGVTEADNGGEYFGEERLEANLKAHRTGTPRSIAEAVMEDIDRFTEESPQSDDITMLVVKRET